jgi:hypothetical protein
MRLSEPKGNQLRINEYTEEYEYIRQCKIQDDDAAVSDNEIHCNDDEYLDDDDAAVSDNEIECNDDEYLDLLPEDVYNELIDQSYRRYSGSSIAAMMNRRPVQF